LEMPADVSVTRPAIPAPRCSDEPTATAQGQRRAVTCAAAQTTHAVWRIQN
jgi:hypothetical protein